jgi:lipopolysaccharide transport system permease protein
MKLLPVSFRETRASEPVADAPSAPEVKPWRPALGASLSEAWQSRHLVMPMLSRVFPDYSQAILGRSWLVIRPGMDIFGKALIFGGVLGARAPNGVPYTIFLLVGLQGWRLFQRTLMFGTRSFRRFNRLNRNLNVPLLLVPVASTAIGVVELLVYQAFTIGVLVYYQVVTGHFYLQVGPQLLVGVAGWLLCLVFAWGIGMFFSVLAARAMDVRFGMRYVLELWLYCTPVVYSLDAVPTRFRALAEANPLTPVMEMIKYGFLGAGQIRLASTVWGVSAILLTCLAGLWFFNRTAPGLRLRDVSDEEDEEDEL